MEKATTVRDFPQQHVCFQPKEAKSRPCSVSQMIQGAADRSEALRCLEQLTRIYCVCLFLRSSVMPKDCFTVAWSPLILISVLTKFKNKKLAVGFCPGDFVCCAYIPYILCLFSLCLTISSNPNLLCFPLKKIPQYSLDAQFLDLSC